MQRSYFVFSPQDLYTSCEHHGVQRYRFTCENTNEQGKNEQKICKILFNVSMLCHSRMSVSKEFQVKRTIK